jgi:hypothetical protein
MEATQTLLNPVLKSGTTTASQVDSAFHKLMRHRKRPLLVLYYPVRSRVSEDDAKDVYTSFRKGKITVEKPLPALDVLVDSYGGDPVAAYRVAQLIRDFAKKVSFLVAHHAYSAATLLCFSGEEIRLAHYAGLSPIDITLVSDPGFRPRREVELASVDSFLEFAISARKRIEELLELMGHESVSRVDSDLLVQMVKEVGALEVGKYFRARTLTGHYAEQLLRSYMFTGCLDAKDKSEKVFNNFLFKAPTHDFHLDYHLCAAWGVTVKEMDTEESDLAKSAIDTLEDLADSTVICPYVSRKSRMPFIQFYKTPNAKNTKNNKPVNGGLKHENRHSQQRR